MLPVAPATDCMASTSGTPAANIVDSVRAKRAIADLTKMGPMIGNLSMIRSIASRMFLERFMEVKERINAAADHHDAATSPDAA